MTARSKIDAAGRAAVVDSMPVLGSGLGYRRELKQAILDARARIDFLEIVADQFLGDRRWLTELEEICAVFPVIPHGVGLSIGSPGLNEEYLRGIRLVSDITASLYYSEHLAMTRAPGIGLGHLTPLWFTEEVLRRTADNVARVQDYLRKPLVLENVTYPFDIPTADMKQTEFFSRLVEATGCGVLLDVTNVFINSANHGFDPVAFLKEMPLDRVVQIHLAGGYERNGAWIDGHCEPVDEGSWRLLDTLAELVPIKGSILEHDSNFPSEISGLLDQVERARRAIAPGAALKMKSSSKVGSAG